MTSYIDILLSYCKLRGISEKDIVPVVRCKDCKRWDKDKGFDDKGYCDLLDSYWRPDEYCSDGKRREE